jgi:uncharacterized protein (DUF2062 family)
VKIVDSIRSFVWSDLPPWKMGLSAAIGAFIAATPTIGLQTVLVLAIVSLLRGNRGVALVASGIANPWTTALIYYADFKAGALFTGDPTWEGLPGGFTLGSLGGVFIQVLAGSLLVGAGLSLVAGATATLLCRLARSRRSPGRCRCEAEL